MVDVLKQLPPQVRAQISTFTAMGPAAHPILSKVTPEHVDRMLGVVEEEGRHKFWEGMSTKGVVLVVLLLVLAFVLILVSMLQDNAPLLEKIITIVVSFAGGLVGGIGIGKLWR